MSKRKEKQPIVIRFSYWQAFITGFFFLVIAAIVGCGIYLCIAIGRALKML